MWWIHDTETNVPYDGQLTSHEGYGLGSAYPNICPECDTDWHYALNMNMKSLILIELLC